MIANYRIDAVTLSCTDLSPAGAAYHDDFVPDFTVIPA